MSALQTLYQCRNLDVNFINFASLILCLFHANVYNYKILGVFRE